MDIKSKKFKIVDAILLACTILPIVAGILIKVLLIPASEGIQISGAFIFFTVKLPFQDLIITEAQINSWLVILSVLFLCFYMTHGIASKPVTKRQLAAEWVIEKTQKLVDDNMGEYFKAFAPFICSIIVLSAFSSLLSLVGLYPPTSDLNIVAGWAILVFFLITYYKMKCGPWHYIKSFAEPVAFLLPLNLVGEVATPVSMAFRHYGNILSGSVISVLLAAGLQGLSSVVLSFMPGFLSEIPLLRIGLPAVLSIYFDVFSGCLQAFIFAMLTMLYVAGAFSFEDYKKIKAKKKKTV